MSSSFCFASVMSESPCCTASRTLDLGSSCGSCGRNPTRRPGIGVASPSNSRSSPAMMRRRLDLPAPFSPSTPIFAPGKNESEMSFRICRLGGTTLPTRFIVYTYCAMRQLSQAAAARPFHPRKRRPRGPPFRDAEQPSARRARRQHGRRESVRRGVLGGLELAPTLLVGVVARGHAKRLLFLGAEEIVVLRDLVRYALVFALHRRRRGLVAVRRLLVGKLLLALGEL